MRVLFLCLISFLSIYAKDLVSVSIAPQAYFVQQIAKDTLDINIVIPPNANEHTFEFKPSGILKLEKSDIYFTANLEFEKIWILKLKDNLKNTKIISTQNGIDFIPLQEHTHEGHHHGDDPHTWLDPLLAKTHAKNITLALIEQYPQNKAFYEQNLENFLKEMDALNLQIQALFKNAKNKHFLVYHPSWGYFAKRYHLSQIPVEIEGKEPKPKDLAKLAKLIQKEQIKAIFVPKGANNNTIKAMASSYNLKIIELDHLPNDYKNELLKDAKNIASVLQ
ncbi:metal ABC transporter solute-binding protein, Zn/Mn family [Campylobacter lari]|uniref:metal ABC transporter solute-binding protein, Zn/Mn family n=1 Tax=Campylobacter lari TaxID=201 RepID=UPI0008752412|nr:zinc ABC transporter substrate-binding protein [Campylobacter lari]EAH7837551.1 cation ABC transporter substrate-binding protein [Campylobacter lari]EAI0924008.1 cation ABC transporter substrate-binding protein [Campylobacter lari]EAI2015494.1 cation ABC transporter substrate-binding protein [Campylobacter lari]EAI2081906.1 cation ABC transporter substrate-binding protein [Campylobacter lari]EAI2314965.1 cation ABC transporter substrate-binding protein [Campylobacter lari]